MKKLVLIPLIFFCFYPFVHSQENTKTDSLGYISFEEAIQAIEQKFHVRFYFDSDRLQFRKVSTTLIDLPFTEAMQRIEKLSGYSSLRMNERSYVLLPYEAIQQGNYQDFTGIGNPLDYGRYSSALIDGQVLDGKTGEPLVGAVVSHDKLKLAANTDNNGKFSMRLPVGDHELTIRYYGYQEAMSRIRIYGNGKLTLELFEKSISLDEVVVRAEMAQNSVMRNQMSMVRMDARAIRELPVTMGETDIIKSVTLMPGVQSVGEFGTGFNVRGGSADQNLVLMEDLPVFNPSHVFGLISIVNPDDISGVTLLKAGIPARYGERVSSVMDIKMGGNHTEKFSGKGGLGLINSRLNFKLPLLNHKVVLSLGGRSSYSDWLLRRIPDPDLRNSAAGFSDLNGMLTVTPNASNRISLFGYYSKDNFQFSNTTRYDYSNLMGGGRWSHIFSNNLSMTTMAGRSLYDLSVKEDLDKPYDITKITTGLIYDCLKWNVNWTMPGKNSVDIGINAIRYTNNPGALVPGSDQSLVLSKKLQNEQAWELSGYLSDNFDITEKINIEAGARFTRYLMTGPYQSRQYAPGVPRSMDHLREVRDFKKNETVYAHNALEPRFSIIYKLNSESSLKASYSRMHQYLNLVSNTTVMSPTDTWKLSDNNIAPLSADQAALGYYRNFTAKGLEASIEIYYKQLGNVFEYKDGAQLLMNQSPETDLVPAKGYNYGAEFYMKKISGRLTGWISYTWSKSLRITTSPFEEEKVNHNRLFPSNFDKPHNLIAVSNYHISRRWRFGATFVFGSGRPVTLPEMKYYFQGNQLVYYSDRNKYRLPSYHRLDVSITLDESLRLKKKWKGSWTFSVINLYGRKNAYSVFYQKESPSMINDYRTFSLYKLYIIGRPLPTLTYNFTF